MLLETDVPFHIPAGGFGGSAGSPPSFGLAAAGNGAAAGAGTAGGAAEGAEEEEAPKEFVPEVKVDESGSAILFKSRAKVYVQGADKARGLRTLESVVCGVRNCAGIQQHPK